MKYNVRIIETLSRIVEVEADSRDEAWDKVETQWKHSEIVLDADDFDGYEIYVLGEVKDEDQDK